MVPDGEFDDLDDLADLDEPWTQPALTVRRPPRRTTVVLLVSGAVVLTGALVGASTLLRTPQERLQARLADALDDAGVELAAPVSLQSGDAGSRLWMGRLSVLDDAGGTTAVRLAVRVDDGAIDGAVDGAGADAADGGATGRVSVESLFPLVDCGTRYPLSYPGDSDSSFRTARSDLVECVSTARGDDGVLVTIAWVDDDGGGAGSGSVGDSDGDGDGGGDGAAGPVAVDRQTWLTDGRGGLVWLHNADGDSGGSAEDEGSGAGLTGEQQRAVATAEGLLDAL